MEMIGPECKEELGERLSKLQKILQAKKENPEANIKENQKELDEFFQKKFSQYNRELFQVIKYMLKIDEEKRYSAQDLLKLDYFQVSIEILWGLSVVGVPTGGERYFGII